MRTQHHRQTIFLGAVLVAIAVTSWARPVYGPSYAEMSSKADLVVLATPVDQPYSYAAVLRPADVSYRVQFIIQARAPPYSA